MRIYHTPDERFSGLPDWPYPPVYTEIAGGLRVHYVDEGAADAQPVLMLHGEPTWGYLYRKMIGPLVAAGFRAVVPDLIGFGRSDKPLAASDYSYAAQVAWMRAWIEALDLRDMILACQDWGSLIGLRLVAEMPDRFAGVALSNGGLPEGQPAPRAFAIWRAFSRFSPVFPIGRIVNAGAKRSLTPDEIAAYDAPFPTRASKVAARVFPSFVPLGDNVAVPDQKRAWAALEAFDKPFLCCFSDGDPITRGGDALFTERVPGARSMAHRTLRGGHFVQENDPAGFVAAIRDVAAAARP
ncbi:MAG: haloalkane dehalogenase [Sphingopyxis macrogoltabida]|uniref:Haloalkane dehalogenase n=1 Tax=Sphingopyxis macrogoltabida TaxID=33050 RepID=A0A2W5LAC2_SPHMC|nr:MAG: haloalkane dehalogenase [Sphingopyxis macrogoltabida]